MSTIAWILTIVVALLHGYFLLLEMVLWTKPVGLQVFGQTREQAEATRVLAANQGLYNGFLAAGLVWGLFTDQRDVVLFFLGCIVVAGVYGGITVNRRILVVQAVPPRWRSWRCCSPDRIEPGGYDQPTVGAWRWYWRSCHRLWRR